MNDTSSQITYSQLLERHERIRIPMIQRDYAQGRPSEEEIREEFLAALEGALRCSPDDHSVPLNLDFIYGSVEQEKDASVFSPLDGQQRLTTLFLLHWYLAWNDEAWTSFQDTFRLDGRSRFSYNVRPSSNEFFNGLVAFLPDRPPTEVTQLSDLIIDQPWYFRNWRLDPTIQSTLCMLDAIHSRFAGSKGLYSRLTDTGKPAITFQLLDLVGFGLSDDLYVKMNARGKPLTPFETFKARYEHDLAAQFPGETRNLDGNDLSIPDFVSRRIDTKWADLFWEHRDKSSNLYDGALMNLFQVVALISRDPADSGYREDFDLLRDEIDPPTYSTFNNRKWLNRAFTEILIAILEAWSSPKGIALLPDDRYFDERKVYDKLSQRSTNLTLTEVIQFVGYALFIRRHEGNIDATAFQEWMRVIHNLAVNSYLERADEVRNAARGVRELLDHSATILPYLSKRKAGDRLSGFLEVQVREEALKAFLIEGRKSWRPLIDQAESHGYFRGQIDFLLDFSGTTNAWKSSDQGYWNEQTHLDHQKRFADYLEKAEAMFTAHGLFDLGQYRWQRGLLSQGNYFLPSSLNHSFLTNSPTDPVSWKRFLRGFNQAEANARPMLKLLWDRLDAGQDPSDQLDQIISSVTGLEPWRDALIKTPAAFEYCPRRYLRIFSEKELYLLKTSQTNGVHAELFTYCLHENVLRDMQSTGRLKPLMLMSYQATKGMGDDPHAWIRFMKGGEYFDFRIEFRSECFWFVIICSDFDNHPEVGSFLEEQGSFKKVANYLQKSCSLPEIETGISSLATLLDSMPELTTSQG